MPVSEDTARGQACLVLGGKGELIEAVGVKPNSAIIDIGGGASRLVDALVEKGFRDLSVLDLSESAVSVAKMRLGHRAGTVKWIVADVTH